jgi:hypothetical protein
MFMSLANCTVLIVTHWLSALLYIWSDLLAFLNLQFPPDLTDALTFT